MDLILRARHDALVAEFLCAATDLRLLRTPPASEWTRTIEAFCGEERADRFGTELTDFASCCAACRFLSLRDEGEVSFDPVEETPEELREPA